MEFALSAKHEKLRDLYREFAEKEVAPLAAEIDETAEFPVATVEKMAKLGFMGIPFSKQYGGAGADNLSYVLAVEELARACATTSAILGVHLLASFGVSLFGNEEQKQKFLVPMTLGKHLGAFALTEPNAGTDASNQQTTAVLEGEHYIINGTKIFISNGGYAQTYIVMAMTEPAKGLKGISAFIIEKGTPGFTFGKKENKMGIRASSTTELIFQDCHVPKENLLGKEGEGFKIAMQCLDGGRISIAAQALGIAQSALDEAVRYAKERQQFGKNIGSFQAVQWMIADMATRVEAARFLTYHAAWLKDNHKPFGKEAAMAKLFASEAASFCANKAIQVHGGYGFMKEYKVERLLRDARITEIYEGTSEVQRMVIATSILK